MSARAYRLASRLIGLLPEPAMRTVGRGAGSLAYFWAKDRRAMADRHMTRVGLGSGRRLFAHYGRYWAELLWLDRRKAGNVRAAITSEGLEHLEPAREAGQGMIYALPHVGNWEVAGLIGEELDLRIIAVAEDLPDSDVTRWFVAKREAMGLQIVIADGRADLTSLLRTHLAGGAAVALLCDRDVTGSGVEVEFFGELTALPAGPAMLSIRSGAPIFPVAMYFRKGRGHHLVVQAPVPVAEEGNLRRRVTDTTQRVARALEGLIRANPEQWHLVQPNWPSDRP